MNAHARLRTLSFSLSAGSRDLPYYMDKLSNRIGTPDLICCLDAGCGNFEQLWITTSLRGNIAAKLEVQVRRVPPPPPSRLCRTSPN